MNKTQGKREPTLAVGVLCEKVLVEKDGVVSAIRLVDKFIVSPKDKKAARQIQEKGVLVNARLLLVFLVEELEKLDLEIQLKGPDGKTISKQNISSEIVKGQNKLNINVELQLNLKSVGRHIFVINTLRKALIDIPFELVHLPPPDQKSGFEVKVSEKPSGL